MKVIVRVESILSNIRLPSSSSRAHTPFYRQPYGPFRRVVIGPSAAMRPSGRSIVHDLESVTGLSGGVASNFLTSERLTLPVMRFLPSDL